MLIVCQSHRELWHTVFAACAGWVTVATAPPAEWGPRLSFCSLLKQCISLIGRRKFPAPAPRGATRCPAGQARSLHRQPPQAQVNVQIDSLIAYSDAAPMRSHSSRTNLWATLLKAIQLSGSASFVRRSPSVARTFQQKGNPLRNFFYKLKRSDFPLVFHHGS